MKKIYLVAVMAFAATFTYAQNAGLTGCVNTAEGSVSIEFDYSQNCATAPGSLAGLAEIGFHSGANQWSSVVDWNAGNAMTASNDGSDVFSVSVVTADYYGVDLASLDNIYMVFNQGPADPNAPWDSEGKDADNDGDGNCDDFFVIIADLDECVVSTTDIALANSLTVAPNPFSEYAVVTFDNPNNKVYDVTMTSLTGQVVKNFQGVAGNSFEIARENLSAGMYFVTFVSEEGKVATTKVAVR